MPVTRTIAFTLVLVSLAAALSVPRAAEPGQAARFDHLVREDFFAGFMGDSARLERGMKSCEGILAAEPAHAEALVWHGSGLLFQSGARFQAGEAAAGQAMWARGLAEVDRAVALAPDAIGVLVPRGAALLSMSRFVPASMARGLIEKGVADYERVLSIQEPYFHTLGDHPRSELLFGLAEGYARLGRPDRARAYFERIVRDVPASGQAPRAQSWLATGTLPDFSNGPSCVGCHRQP